jgi:NhaP-type Na+/H+ or K+/H+ antiporter
MDFGHMLGGIVIGLIVAFAVVYVLKLLDRHYPPKDK